MATAPLPRAVDQALWPPYRRSPARQCRDQGPGRPHGRREPTLGCPPHPTAAWTTQQLVDASPDDSAPPYLLRDRDCVYGHAFRQRVKGMGIGEVVTAPHSPWQNPFAERLIGSVRRECLDHVVVLTE